MTYPAKFGVFYDFRNPPQWQQPWSRRYRELLDQIRWVDQAGDFDEVSLTEHHFVDDGYSPSILSLAAAVATSTSRVGIVTNIVQLPLHHPLRVAEDALTADALSDGRFRLGVAAGYRTLEFEALGTSTRHRASRMQEGIAILRKAFTGQRFSFQGQHWQFPEVAVTPGPIREGGPQIWLGGKAPAALARAAALGDGFLASRNEDVTGFLAAAEKIGRTELRGRTARTARLLIAPDPSRALHELGDHILHQVNQYIDFGFIDHNYYHDAQEVVRDGHYEVVDATGAVATFAAAATAGVNEFHLMAALPGEPVESATTRLQYVASQVLPRMRPTTRGE